MKRKIIGAFTILAVFAAAFVVFTAGWFEKPAPAASPVAGAFSAKAGSGGVTAKTFVKLSAARTIVASTAVTDSVVGVCELTAAANALTRYAPAGTEATVTSGELIAVGDLLTTGTGGKAFVLDADDASTQRVAAMALTAASGADEDVTVVVLASAVEQRLLPPALSAGGDAEVGVPFLVIFEPTAAGTLSYTVPAGRKLRVLDAYGFKMAGAGAHADDDLNLQNNDGSAANIFATEELNTVADKARILFDSLDDAERDVAAASTLDLVANENAGNGCDATVYVVCVWVTP